jgi:hypothetical protein
MVASSGHLLVETVRHTLCPHAERDLKASPLLFEDVVQPVEFDLMFEARVIECAVSLAAIYCANQTFRLRAGQLLVELVARGHYQWPFALAGYVQERARDLPLEPGQTVSGEVVTPCSGRASASP